MAALAECDRVATLTARAANERQLGSGRKQPLADAETYAPVCDRLMRFAAVEIVRYFLRARIQTDNVQRIFVHPERARISRCRRFTVHVQIVLAAQQRRVEIEPI